MSFSKTVRQILSQSNSLTAQEIRAIIINQYPQYYGTASHIKNVSNGNYKDINHALLAQIYSLSLSAKWIHCDNTVKPKKLSLNPDNNKPKSVISSRPARKTKPSDFCDKVEALLCNLVEYHESFYKASTFVGPSLYFHRRALEAAKDAPATKFFEYIYAVLTSWGMHRMGSKGSKMQDFKTFHNSLDLLENSLKDARNFNCLEMTEARWECVRTIFKGVNVMASSTSLVGNSKVMHHLLPNLIPPIDREYTLWFLRGNTTIKNDLEHEWQMMRDIISDFFIPVVRDERFKGLAQEWMKNQSDYPWDTSMMKIVDNLIIGAKKLLNE